MKTRWRRMKKQKARQDKITPDNTRQSKQKGETGQDNTRQHKTKQMCAGYEEMSTKHHTNECYKRQDKTRHFDKHIGKTNKRGTGQDKTRHGKDRQKNKDKNMTKKKAEHDKTRQTRHLVSPY